MLAALGRELASTRSWWGGGRGDSAGGSVISVDQLGAGRYRVTFRDVIGAVRIGGRQLQVSPKIPMRHFLYLASRSSIAPRLSASQIRIEGSGGLIEVLVRWTLSAAEALLRLGMRKDYKAFVDELPEVQGRTLACETTLNALRGRAVAACEFEELSDDAPLNRVIRSACERIARLSLISEDSRRRGRLMAYRMDGVGPVRPGDERISVDRLSRSYLRVIPLALLVLAGCGISTSLGKSTGTTFLIRTPELIEDSLRSILSEALSAVGIAKRRLMLGESGLSVNPDLVFGMDIGVGDVKYRFLGSDWNRADLNQLVAFATAFGCKQAILLGFVRESTSSRPKAVPMGQVQASAYGWIASDSVAPEDSAARLVAHVGHWLSIPTR
jgi:5-methylcytosine-specific restriction enzyme subunit McrC